MSRITIAIFLCTVSTLGAQQPNKNDPAPLSDDVVAKLIAKLGAEDFQTRDKATRDLEKLGEPVLPALRKAAADKVSLEVKRRIVELVERIEQVPLVAELKAWEEFDAPRRGIKDRLIKMVSRNPPPSDDELAKATYLLIFGRAPTDAEKAPALKAFKERDIRVVPMLEFARTLVKKDEFKPEIAAANSSVLKLHKDLQVNLAEKLVKLNSPEFQKSIREISASLNKAVKADGDFVDLAYLITTSRFPDAGPAKMVANHLKQGSRAMAVENVVWALLNSKEFLSAP